MNQASVIKLFVEAWAVLSLAASANAERPNILYILADDMGYGDVQCLNPGRVTQTGPVPYELYIIAAVAIDQLRPARSKR